MRLTVLFIPLIILLLIVLLLHVAPSILDAVKAAITAIRQMKEVLLTPH